MIDAGRDLPRLLVATMPLILISAGCSNPPDRSRETPVAESPKAELSPAERIRLAAAREAARNDDRTGTEIPPGVDPDRLAPVDPTDQKARHSISQALADLGGEDSPREPAELSPPSDADFLEAELRFIEGRERYLEGDHFEAIKVLEQARRLDSSSTAILRLLARTHVAASAHARAREVYRRLLELEPGDTEALIRVAEYHIERGRHAEAAPLLGRIIAPVEEDEQPEAERYIAAERLGDALYELGYIAAAIEAWRLATDLPRRAPMSPTFDDEIETLYREQGERWQVTGDAHVRLGELDKASYAYQRASEFPLVEPEALLSRIVYLDLRRGREYSALASLLRQFEAGDPTTAAIELLRYVRPLEGSATLAAALAQLVQNQPGSLHIAKALATLATDARGAAALLDYLENHPQDERALRDVLAWAVDRDELAWALTITTERVKRLNESPTPMVSELRALVYDPATLIDAWSRLSTELRDSVAGELVHASMLRFSGRDSETIDVLDAAIAQHPDSEALRLARIEWLVRNDLVDVARDELDTLVDTPLSLAANVYRATDAYIRIGAGPEALRLLRDLEVRAESGSAPPDFEAREYRHERVEALVLLGQIAMAKAQLRDAIDADPDDEWAYAMLLRLTGAEGASPDVEVYRATAMALTRAAPQSRSFRYFRAQQDAAFRSVSRAIQEFQSLVIEDPTDAEALGALVSAWIAAEEAGAGVNWVQDRLKHRPGDPLLRDALVELLMANQRSSQAIELLRSELARRPGDESVSLKLEQTLRRVGRLSEAIEVARDRLESRPPSPRRSIQLARVAVEANEVDLALDHLEEAFTAAQGRLEAHVESLQSVAAATAEIDESGRSNQFIVRLLDQALQDGVALGATMHAERLAALARADRPIDELQTALEAATSAHPDQRSAFVVQARASLLLADRSDDALRLVDQILNEQEEFGPDDVELVEWRLAHAAMRNEPQLAIDLVYRLYESGVLKQPGQEKPTYKDLGELFYQLSVNFHGAGSEDSAEIILAEALKIDPDHAMANNNLAYALIDRDERLEEAEAMLLKACEVEQAENDGGAITYNVLDSLGWLRYKQGQMTDEGEAVEELGAITLLERAAKAPEASDNTVILDHLGDAYWRAGRSDEARHAWREAIRSYDRLLMGVRNEAELTAWVEENFGPVADAAKAKLEAVENAGDPPVAYSPGADNGVRETSPAAVDGPESSSQ